MNEQTGEQTEAAMARQAGVPATDQAVAPAIEATVAPATGRTDHQRESPTTVTYQATVRNDAQHEVPQINDPEQGAPWRLADLLAQAAGLAQAGGLSPAATDAQKWHAGDLVGAMARVVEAARDRLLDPRLPATSQDTARFRACSAAYDEFLAAQGLTRGSLVDMALTATTFPPGHPMRGGALSFSHARTLTRLASPHDRAAWAARAVRERLSVAMMQALINTAGPGGTDGGRTVSGDGDGLRAGPDSQRRRPHHLHVCAFTGAEIADLSAMVELRANLDTAGKDALAVRSARTPPRGGAARAGLGGRYPALLRFAGLTTLAQWLAERERRLQGQGRQETATGEEGQDEA